MNNVNIYGTLQRGRVLPLFLIGKGHVDICTYLKHYLAERPCVEAGAIFLPYNFDNQVNHTISVKNITSISGDGCYYLVS